MNKTCIAVIGAKGRMGQQICLVADNDKQTKLVAAIDAISGDETLQLPNTNISYSQIQTADVSSADVIIGFASPDGITDTLNFASEKSKPLVLGSTGITDEHKELINNLATKVPVFVSANFSLGVNLLLELTKIASQKLEDWDTEVFELHHNQKVDSPSGTAEAILDVIKNSSNKDLNVNYERFTNQTKRDPNEIGVGVLRGGDAAGEHTVFYFSDGERLELTHRATNRIIFAKGAVLAAKFVADKQPGLYDMKDLLQLS